MYTNFRFGNIEVFIQRQEEMRQYRERLKHYCIEDNENGFVVEIADPEIEQILQNFLRNLTSIID